jgi:biopolymer transport protein ExbD
MSTGEPAWDVFESESLSVRRGQSQSAILTALAAGELTPDDLARPAGTSTPWRRLGDVLPEWPSQSSAQPPAAPTPPPAPAKVAPKTAEPSVEMQALQWLSDQPQPAEAARPAAAAPEPQRPAVRDLPLLEPSIELEPYQQSEAELHIAQAEDDEEEFTLSRSSVEKVEELDLAAMVDVAFQLVLFFMVTASVTLIKSMELPKPTESTKPAAASAPGVGSRNKNEVESDFIVVAITADGEIRVEDEPATAEQLVERLREARTATGKTGMILRAENKTRHRTAVAAYDAANAIGLRIAIEREVAP